MYPRGQPQMSPRIQFEFEQQRENFEDKNIREKRQAAVKESFIHAWEGYKKNAWMKDEVAPLTGGWRSSFGGWGATMIDSMDTLLIMGLNEDFKQCVEEVGSIDFTTNTEDTLNVFETTIRYIGGLLAAYDLTDRRHKILLTKARELGDILYTAFDTPNRMPNTRWQWRKSALGGQIEESTSTLLAEIGSLSLEFTRLTQLTGDPKYYDAVARIMDAMEEIQFHSSMPGLWPTIINAKELTAEYNHFTLAGMADSTYEYLPKQYLMLGCKDRQPWGMYDNAMALAKRYLFFRPLIPGGRDVLVSGNAALIEGVPELDPQGQHLGCFIGGMMGIAAKIFNKPDDLITARRLVDGCIMAYEAFPSGLMPETFHMIPCHTGIGNANGSECDWSDDKWYEAVAERHGSNSETQSLTLRETGEYWVKKKGLVPGFIDVGDARYILRPEAIESVFILYRITGDMGLQNVAWKMFQAIEKATRTDIAHAAVIDVRLATPEKSDRMESFWLAETLKYFYLMFSDPNLINLDSYVL